MSIPTPESLDVSRETFERLEIYVALLTKWSSRINLVSKFTLSDVWQRHIADSLQVLRVGGQEATHWVDLGTGGGLPGLVVAIARPDGIARVTLIESDQRKAAFLQTVLRETGCHATVIPDRIELAQPQSADILSARALAPLPKLLEFAQRHRTTDGTALFSKGARWKEEVEEAQKSFAFDFDTVDSCTQQGAVLLRIGEISRV